MDIGERRVFELTVGEEMRKVVQFQYTEWVGCKPTDSPQDIDYDGTWPPMNTFCLSLPVAIFFFLAGPWRATGHR